MDKQFYSYCLKGDINLAYDYLQSKEKNQKEVKFLKRLENRFYSKNPVFRYKTKDLWIRKVLKAYYEYFIVGLTKFDALHTAEIQLLKRLKETLPNGVEFSDLDSVEEELEKEFKRRGYHFLGGVTPPFRGPYIWKHEEKVEYEIELPSGIQQVTVYFMSDFIMLGWLHFATFGAMSAGGWAKKTALYCVKDRYEKILHKPDFLCSYLAHEAQHFSDYQQFPSLKSCDLEYRAKLVELIYHPHNTSSLITKFIYEADNNKNNPHSYASYVICRNLSNLIFKSEYLSDVVEWEKIDPQILSNEAKRLLQQHTVDLSAKGKLNVEGVI